MSTFVCNNVGTVTGIFFKERVDINFQIRCHQLQPSCAPLPRPLTSVSEPPAGLHTTVMFASTVVFVLCFSEGIITTNVNYCLV